MKPDKILAALESLTLTREQIAKLERVLERERGRLEQEDKWADRVEWTARILKGVTGE